MAKLSQIEKMTRPQCYARWQEILENAEKNGEPLTASERAECRSIEEQIEWCQKNPLTIPNSGRHPSGPARFGYHSQAGFVHTVGHGESLSDAVDASTDQPGLGAAIRFLGTGVGSERAGMTGTSDTSGGFLLSSQTSTNVLDLARNEMVMSLAGVRVLPINKSEAIFPRQLTDATASWRHEGAAIVASSPTFGQWVCRPRVLGVLCSITKELLQDAVGSEAALERAMTQSLALELDRVILRGAGAAAEPSGILNWPGTTTRSGVGAPLSYDMLTRAMQDVYAANFDPKTVIANSAVWGMKSRFADGNGIFMTWAPVDKLQWLTTNQCPNDEIYVGDFSKVVLLSRTPITLEKLAVGTGVTSGGVSVNALTDLAVWFRAYVRVDVLVEQPKAMCVLSNFTIS